MIATTTILPEEGSGVKFPVPPADNPAMKDLACALILLVIGGFLVAGVWTACSDTGPATPPLTRPLGAGGPQ